MMRLHFFKMGSLKRELNKLSALHRLAFGASCCERILPNYNTFYQKENWGNHSILRRALDEIWEIIQGKPTDIVKIDELKEYCNSDDVIPDDRFWISGWGGNKEAKSLTQKG